MLKDSASCASLIPDEGARFVSAHIDSVAEIEALFLLRNAARQS